MVYAVIRKALRGMGMNLVLTATDLRQMVADSTAYLRRTPADQVHSGMLQAAASMAVSEQPMTPVQSNDSTPRSDEPVNLSPAIIAHPLGAAGKHPDYKAAKSGDTEAAIRLVGDLVTSDVADQIRREYAGKVTAIVPVLAIESSGRNKIPAVTAARIAEALGVPVETDIIQSVKAKRSALGGLDRIFQQPAFAGTVKAGESYLLLDDTLTQGGTLAALATHIQRGGGSVAGSFVLTGKQYSATLRLSPETLKTLKDRYGDIESDFRTATGIGFESLTESEGRYLAKHDTPDAVRSRILAKRDEASRGARPRGLGQKVARSKPLNAEEDETPPSAGFVDSGPMESRAASMAPGAPTTGGRPSGKGVERPGEGLREFERKQREKTLHKIGAFALKESLCARFDKLAERWQDKLAQGALYLTMKDDEEYKALRGLATWMAHPAWSCWFAGSDQKTLRRHSARSKQLFA